MSTEAPVKPRPRRKKKGQFHHGDLAEQVGLLAAQVVEAEGHAAVSMKRLAQRLGVSEPALYRHYPSREHLLADVAARGLVDFLDEVHPQVAALTDPREGLRAYGRAYVRAAFRRPNWFRLMFTNFGIVGLVKFPQAAARAAAAQQRDGEIIMRWRLLEPDDPRTMDLVRLIWAALHGLAVFLVEGVFQRAPTEAEQLATADRVVDLLVQSLEALRGIRP